MIGIRFGGRLSTIRPVRRCGLHIRGAAGTAPLVRLERAVIPHLHPDTAHVSFAIPNDSSELWAVIGPPNSSGRGAKTVNSLISILAARSHPRQAATQGGDSSIHPSVHPFIKGDASRHVGLAAFAKRVDAGAGGNDFQDFTSRYGALRDEDHITLFEQIMFDQGFEVGRVARLRIVPDRLSEHETDQEVREAAHDTQSHVERIAPLLALDVPGPGSGCGAPVLLHQPIISLSNGQTRRASICAALVGLARQAGETDATLLVLVQPFSGLDEPTRNALSTLLSDLHAKGTPRIVLALRRQDEVPEGVTHIIDVDAEGKIWTGSRSEWRGAGGIRPRGFEGIRANRGRGIGVGKGHAIACLQNVSVKYGEVTVLDDVSLTLRPGSRLIVKGANGSGKTTLLALLSGTHPQSFSLDERSYKLFGLPRSHPSNASRILRRRIGYFGPDLLSAFPRRGVESGGLTVYHAIASGFEGVFSRVDTSPQQRRRIELLVDLFHDQFGFRDDRMTTTETRTLLSRPFISLDTASQALTLFLRAVVGNPDLLILDEPFQGMDAAQVARIRAFLDAPQHAPNETDDAGAVKKQEQCLVLVSHYTNEWPDTMGEYMLLDAGRVIDRAE